MGLASYKTRGTGSATVKVDRDRLPIQNDHQRAFLRLTWVVYRLYLLQVVLSHDQVPGPMIRGYVILSNESAIAGGLVVLLSISTSRVRSIYSRPRGAR